LEILRLVDVVDRDHPDDQLVSAWCSFDRIEAGAEIGIRADGQTVVAPGPGFIVFPNPKALPGNEWFYRAEVSSRRVDGCTSYPLI